LPVYNEMQLSSFVDQIFERLRALEAQMVRVSEAAGVSYDAPGAGCPKRSSTWSRRVTAWAR
jgi:hypothetical protein